MFLNGITGIGWAFFGLANVVGICRFGITQAEKIEEGKQKSRLEKEITTLLEQQDTSSVPETFPKLVH